jgi:DNA-binding transcriptional MerR regulator
MYSVTAASRMSGVHPETLRAWERRYEAICPRRDERGRRVYAPEDVERLILLRRATERGHAISRLAGMGLEDLRRISEEGGDATAAATLGDGGLNQLVGRLLDAVRRYRADECDEVLGLAATFLEPERLVGQVVAPALHLARESVSGGSLRVAQERLLGRSARRTIGSLVSSYRSRAQGPVVVLASLAGERDEVALMVTALMTVCEGLDCVYLGPEVPHDDLADAVRSTQARCLILSCTGGCPDGRALAEVAAALPGGCELWLAGEAVAGDHGVTLPAGCTCIVEREALRERARALCRA